MAMQKTTVYLPDELKAALERAASASRRSEADLIREGVRRIADEYASPSPRIPLFSSGDSELAEHVDEALQGFGEQ